MRKKSFISFVFMFAIFSMMLASCSCSKQETTAQVDEDIPYIFTLDEDGWREYGIPSSFDLRSVDTDGDGVGDRCFVTKVKLQDPYGTCWAFGAVSAAETSILGSIYLNDEDAYKTLDLSEKQLSYFLFSPIDDENNAQNGEGFYLESDSNLNLYNIGGDYYCSSFLFSQGVGLSDECKEGNEILAYRGANGYTEQRAINGGFHNYCYSDDDDWSIPESYRFSFDYLLKSAILLPTPAEFEKDETGTEQYKYNSEATEAIKLQLLQRRGVTLACYVDMAATAGSYSECTETNNWAQYLWEKRAANHGMTIVGWDDDYPKENFVEEHQPPENGAWLVKNNWGSGENDFPNMGYGNWGIKTPLKDSDGNIVYNENGEPVMVGSGYFWMSYYDNNITQPMSFVFDKKIEEKDYIIDQHNYLPVTGYEYKTYDSEFKMSNIFNAKQNQILDSISFVSPKNDLTIDYKVYLLVDGFDGPEDGFAISKGRHQIKYSGCYRVELDKQVIVQKGQSYSVVITLYDEDGNYYQNVVAEDVAEKSYKVRSVINKGESYFCKGNQWFDLKDSLDELIIDETKNLVFDNYPIKAICYGKKDNLNMKFIDTTGTLGEMYLDQRFNYAYIYMTFKGDANMEMGTPEIKLDIAEEDNDIISVATSELGWIDVHANNLGTAYFAVTVDGVGTSVFKFEVLPLEIGSIDIENVTYTGEELTPNVSVSSNAGGSLVEGDDYTIEFSNNTNCGIGKVVITPIDIDFAEGVSAIQYFEIIPPTPEFDTITIENGKLVGSIVDMSNVGAKYNLRYRKVGDDEWTNEVLNAKDFEIAVEEGFDYEVSINAFIDVSDMEMDERIKANTYNEESDAYFVKSEWSDTLQVSKDNE